MSKIKIVLTLIASALGIFGANEYYKPKNVKDLLKWRGVKLASGNKVWRSMLFENQNDLINLGIYSENSLWSWCSERFKQKNLNDENELSVTKKYCSDNPTLIMARIIRDGEDEKVIKKDDIEAFSINYLLSDDVLGVLKLLDLTEESKPTNLVVGKKLSEWCEKRKTTKIVDSEDLEEFSSFKKRCYNREVRTVSQLLKKQGRKVMTRGEEFRKRFDEELKNAPKLIAELRSILHLRQGELMTAWDFRKRARAKLISPEELEEENKKEIERIKAIIPDSPSEEDLKKNGWEHFKWWCEKKIKTPLIETDMSAENYGAISYRCTEQTAN